VLDNLVGLGGGLESRVAGVVLVLVACSGGTSPVSKWYEHARAQYFPKPFRSLRVQARAHICPLLTILLFQKIQESKQGAGVYVL